jgi:voltage-gated potassium channel
MAEQSDVKKRVHDVLEAAPEAGALGQYFGFFIGGFIILNVVGVILETEPGLFARFHTVFTTFERVSLGVFTVEYALRLWSCTADPRYAHPVGGRLRWAVSFMGVVDLLSFAPGYLPGVVDTRSLRILRMFRLLRIFKLGRYADSVSSIGRVLRSKKEELVIAVLTVASILLIAATLMYFVENAAQPDKFGSIPATMWWAIITLTTVGYGDVYPITPVGKLLGAIIAVLGVGMVALPAGILASGFADEIRASRQRAAQAGQVCPQCGQPLPGAAEGQSGAG